MGLKEVLAVGFYSDRLQRGARRAMLPDMLRVTLSVKAGTIMPSTILRRLATYSRKNKLYRLRRLTGITRD